MEGSIPSDGLSKTQGYGKTSQEINLVFTFLINRGRRKLKVGLEMPKYEMFEIFRARSPLGTIPGKGASITPSLLEVPLLLAL